MAPPVPNSTAQQPSAIRMPPCHRPTTTAALPHSNPEPARCNQEQKHRPPRKACFNHKHLSCKPKPANCKNALTLSCKHVPASTAAALGVAGLMLQRVTRALGKQRATLGGNVDMTEKIGATGPTKLHHAPQKTRALQPATVPFGHPASAVSTPCGPTGRPLKPVRRLHRTPAESGPTRLRDSARL